MGKAREGNCRREAAPISPPTSLDKKGAARQKRKKAKIHKSYTAQISAANQ